MTYVTAPAPGYWDKGKKVGEGVDLSHGVKLAPTPDWVRKEDIKELVGSEQWKRIINANLSFILDFEKSNQAEPRPEWFDKTDANRAQAELLAMANLAIWMAKPCGIGFETIIRSEGQPYAAGNMQMSGPHSKLMAHPAYERDKLARSDFEFAKELHKALVGLPRGGTLWTAVRLLWRAISLDFWYWESRFIMLWVVMEAIYGPANRRRITQKLSGRAGAFLGESKEETARISEDIRNGYDWRCRVSHGARLANLNKDTLFRICFEAEDFTRRTLKKILVDEDRVAMVDGRKREKYLNSLRRSA